MSGHRVLLIAAVLALSACATTKQPPLPVRQYVPVPKELTRREPIPDGKRSEVFEVARKRKSLLQQCYGQLEQIEGLKAPP